MKKHNANRTKLSEAPGTEPPTEFRLFPLGKVSTTKGEFILTPADATRCVERQREVGNELSIDYGHGVFNEADGPPQRAAGWISGLEVRTDGLWAIGVTWTEAAANMLRAREQRYYSPAFMTDEEGHITEILNVALTLMPATHNLTPLVASRRSGTTAHTLTKRTTSMEEKYVSAEELLKLADDLEKMADGEDDEKKELKALADKCRKMAEGGETLKKLADDAAPESEKKEEAKKTSDDEKKDDAEKTAEDDEKKEEAKAASRIVAAAREATGEKDPSRIVGALKALGESQGAVSKLSARIAELEASDKAAKEQAKKDRVTALVKASATPGPKCKVTPAEVDALIGWGLKDEDALKAYLSAKPLIVAASAAPAPAAKPDRAALLSAITPDQATVIKASGLTVEEYVDGLTKLPA